MNTAEVICQALCFKCQAFLGWAKGRNCRVKTYVIVRDATRPRVERTVGVWPPCPRQRASCYKIFTIRSQYLPTTSRAPTLCLTFNFSSTPVQSWLRSPQSLIELTWGLKWHTNLRPAGHWPNSLDESQSFESPSLFLPLHQPTGHSKGLNRSPPWVDVVVWSYRAFMLRTGPRRKTD